MAYRGDPGKDPNLILVKTDPDESRYFCESPKIILNRIREILIEKITNGSGSYYADPGKTFEKEAWFDIHVKILRDTAQLVSVGKAKLAAKIESACRNFDFHEAVDIIDNELNSTTIG